MKNNKVDVVTRDLLEADFHVSDLIRLEISLLCLWELLLCEMLIRKSADTAPAVTKESNQLTTWPWSDFIMIAPWENIKHQKMSHLDLHKPTSFLRK